MEGASSKALDALGQFPIVQASVAVLILLGGIYMIFKASKDRVRPPELIPQWLMMGPLYDMMGAVHDVAEETRRTNDLLRENKELLSDVLQETRNTRQTLELIRNESRLR
jgi:hypothetical protein